jgi:hypothetical protein
MTQIPRQRGSRPSPRRRRGWRAVVIWAVRTATGVALLVVVGLLVTGKIH